MASLTPHPILAQSFAVIDQEMGDHGLPPAEYAVLRRVIHSTADFDFAHLLRFSPDAINQGIAALTAQTPIVVDVGMVRQGVQAMVQRTFGNPLLTAIDLAAAAQPGCTRSETGLLQAWQQVPQAIFVIGNAPTALLALCDRIASSDVKPALVIGVPVGFIAVVDAKQALAQTPVPQIRVDGRKGGSSVAAAILNALLVLAWEAQP